MSVGDGLTRSDRVRLTVEVISALGVILTLAFVGWELRQNTAEAALNRRAAEVQAYQDLIAQISDLNRLAIENPGFNPLRGRMRPGDSTMTDVEQVQLAAFLWLLFRHGDLAYHHYERGLLSRERLESVLSPLTARFVIPGMREEWEGRRPSFAPGYQRYIDSVFASLPASTGAEP